MAQKELSEKDFQKLFQLARKTQWQYQLGQYEDAALKEILKSVTLARKEISQELQAAGRSLSDPFGMSKQKRERLEAIADELQDMTIATRAQITGDITDVTVISGVESYSAQNAILSWDGKVPSFNPVSITADQLRAVVSEVPIGGFILSDWVERTFETNIREQFKTEVIAGMLKGEGYPALVKRFTGKAFDGLKQDVISLVRSYVQTANVQAMQDVADANQDIIKGWKWSSATENGSFKTGRGICIRCLALDSADKVYPRDGGPPMPLHVRCLVGETPVFSPDKRAAFVSTYNGPVIDIGISDGRRLSVTPNHMFLTPDGFISAQLLRKGDQIFDSTIAKRVIGRHPNDNDSPSSIKNVVRTLSESSGMATIRVPSSTENFHGDGRGCDGYVDIIAPDSFLGDARNLSFSEFVEKFGFDRGDMRQIGFDALCDFTSMLFALRDSTDGGMGSRSVSPIFLRRSILHHKSVGIGIIPYGDAISGESFSYDIPGYTERIGYGILGLPRGIPLADFFDREFFGKSVKLDTIDLQHIEDFGLAYSRRDSDFIEWFSRYIGGAYRAFGNFKISSVPTDSVSLENGINGGVGYSDDILNVVDAFPGQIELANVSFIRKRNFSGHVYDLQSFSSLYAANGLLSSNCRCTKQYITKTFREMGLDIDEMKQAYRPYTIRGNVDAETGELIPQSVGTGGRKIVDVGSFIGPYGLQFKKFPATIQRQTLGPRRYELWKSGKIKLSDLVDKNGNLLLLKELGGKQSAIELIERGFNQSGKKMYTMPIKHIKTDDWKTRTKVKIGDNGKIELVSGPFTPDISDVRNMVQDGLTEKFSPLKENEFLRFTNNKDEINLIESKKIRLSKNWATGEEELGLSVAEHAGYSIEGYKYGYKIRGEIIGWGSDSEPLLDLGKTISTSEMKTAKYLGQEFLKGYQSNMKKYGWTKEHYTAATSSIKLID